MGSVIILNGASSAGKSTLANAVRDAADVPFLRMSLDFFFFGDMLPPLGKDGFDWKQIRPRVMAGCEGCIAALAHAGSNVVVDHIFESQKLFDSMMKSLEGIDVFLVGVHCPLHELVQRELARGDRRAGDAERDLETVHTFCTYHFEVDSRLPADENAQKILAEWAGRFV